MQLYLLDPRWYPEGSYKIGSVCPSICPGIFLELYHQFFLNFGMVLESHMKLCMTELDFPEKIFWTKNQKNGPETGFFEFIEKFGHQYLLKLFYDQNIYYLLCSCTNPLSGKIFVPEIWAKMFSANQTVGYFYQPFCRRN